MPDDVIMGEPEDEEEEPQVREIPDEEADDLPAPEEIPSEEGE